MCMCCVNIEYLGSLSIIILICAKCLEVMCYDYIYCAALPLCAELFRLMKSTSVSLEIRLVFDLDCTSCILEMKEGEGEGLRERGKEGKKKCNK